MKFKKGDWVLVTCYPIPKRAQVLRECHRAPGKWVVRFEETNFVETVKEKYLKKVTK